MTVGDVGHELDAVETMIGLRYPAEAYAAKEHPPALTSPGPEGAGIPTVAREVSCFIADCLSGRIFP
ncbi:hypothetical protein [Micromonospora sp. NPDC007230]|uniref:hypothetical protein n=1 Tax=Micromonospora sp. NPDC007230 TaxID=3364237 RepID=UPI0036CEEEEB